MTALREQLFAEAFSELVARASSEPFVSLREIDRRPNPRKPTSASPRSLYSDLDAALAGRDLDPVIDLPRILSDGGDAEIGVERRRRSREDCQPLS